MLFPVLALLTTPAKPLLLAHYMPWYGAKPESREWGWHWTMGKLDPDKEQNGRRPAASHFYPLMGLYDSGDPQALECHALLLKFAGIDGVFVDWYGNLNVYDYAINHRNTERMFAAVKKAGLKFSLVYEDQTVPNLIKFGKFQKEQAVDQGKLLMRWLQEHWFRSPSYLKLDGKPVLLVFGPQYYKPEDWSSLFEGLSPQPALFTLHHRRGPAIGAYDWPLPAGGWEGSQKERAAFYDRAKDWPAVIPAAYPRFRDFYKDAGIHDSWGNIDDQNGATYERTLKDALSRKAPFAQIATWNDWGEGTMIEPSAEFGYRDLETTQRLHRSRYRAADLRLPIRLYRLQKKHPADAKLAKISEMLFRDRLTEARRALDQYEKDSNLAQATSG
ncbi:glycoside hydrolase family 71/99-like protein [Fimbriimonas ginsengisoli]|uniref:glycoside hydrolase family 71/99-like protein n=1 Tax=Fimbriimonas ginsengisoli TaxID=1005039 RepID=UPI00046CC539|nr:glycoside hydrolase family 71/99-like protein [Fimbriimonas ginsengisoli]